MNESQGSSLAACRPPAPRAVLALGARVCSLACATLAAASLLAACGQKGPLFLPAQAGKAATPVATPASAPGDGTLPAAPPGAASAPVPSPPAPN